MEVKLSEKNTSLQPELFYLHLLDAFSCSQTVGKMKNITQFEHFIQDIMVLMPNRGIHVYCTRGCGRIRYLGLFLSSYCRAIRHGLFCFFTESMDKLYFFLL